MPEGTQRLRSSQIADRIIAISSSKIMKIIATIGQISAGKSTFLTEMGQRNPQYKIVPECLDRFREFQDFDPLKLSYENPYENAVTAQFHIIRSLNDHLVESVVNTTNSPALILSDRSLYSPIVFSGAFCKMGIISKFSEEYLRFATIQAAKDTMRSLQIEYVGAFYIKVDASVAKNRIQQRNREIEKTISLDYLYAIEEEMENHLSMWKTMCGEENVHVTYSKPVSLLCAEMNAFIERLNV